MRRYLFILLALALPFQAVFAATTVLADAIEHAHHPGHHSHGPVHDHAQDSDSDDVPQQGNDPHHSHAYPAFSPILPTLPDLSPSRAASAQPGPPRTAYASAPRPRLERPPRARPLV